MNHPNAGKCRNGATSNRCDARFSNGILSSPLPIKAGVPQGSVLDRILFRVFINNLSDFLKNPLYLFADDSTLCREIPHPSDRQAAASSLSSDLDKNHKTGQTLGICLLTLRNRGINQSISSLSLSLIIIARTIIANAPIYFLNNHLKEVQSLKLLDFTFSHDFSWANHISKLTPKPVSVVQSPSLAHLNSYPPMRLSCAA